jgi:hypothetical protein
MSLTQIRVNITRKLTPPDVQLWIKDMARPGIEKLGIFVRANTIEAEELIAITKTLISKQ